MKPTWIMRGGLGILVWIASAIGSAHAGMISPVSGSSTGVTLSIFQISGGAFVDITDTYLPEWAPAAPPQIVFVVVNGSTAVPTLVDANPSITATNPNPFLNRTNPNASTTSHYPGNCTNVGTDAGPDFTMSTVAGLVTVPTPTGPKTGYPLTSNDCGGMAVIQVATGVITDTFIIPRDTNLNGIPDSWEATFCPANSCPTGKEDLDASPGNQASGDGIAALDEYRGFIVSGTHVRTDPRQKDLFVHLVNPQCGTTSLLVGATFASGIPLFTNLNTLISGTQMHTLGYVPGTTNLSPMNEWVDNFHHYSVADGVRFGDGTLTTAPVGDRWVTPNRIYTTDSLGNPLPAQKGLRIIECLDTSAPSLLGFASLGSPNGSDNAIIFTQRIVNYFTGTLAATCTTASPCTYSTFQSGAWTTPVTISLNDLIARAIEFYLAMEIGHSIQLTPTVEGTSRTSYGYHHAPGTGSNLDQAITNKVSSKTGNTFYIPLLYNASDQQNFQLK